MKSKGLVLILPWLLFVVATSPIRGSLFVSAQERQGTIDDPSLDTGVGGEGNETVSVSLDPSNDSQRGRWHGTARKV
jgi:hypothetical protein